MSKKEKDIAYEYIVNNLKYGVWRMMKKKIEK